MHIGNQDLKLKAAPNFARAEPYPHMCKHLLLSISCGVAAQRDAGMAAAQGTAAMPQQPSIFFITAEYWRSRRAGQAIHWNWARAQPAALTQQQAACGGGGMEGVRRAPPTPSIAHMAAGQAYVSRQRAPARAWAYIAAGWL